MILRAQSSPKMKITSYVIDRSLKPILNMFFGQRKSKQFRRECDRLSRDKAIRNCGPGFILRSALSTMPCKLLVQPFAKTEELEDAAIPIHVGPAIAGAVNELTIGVPWARTGSGGPRGSFGKLLFPLVHPIPPHLTQFPQSYGF